MNTIRVHPGASNPSHEISLSDGVQTWGLRLDGGPKALQEEPITPSTLRFNALSGFGAWEPGLAEVEQRDWSGGRGQARFSSEAELARSFYDSQNAWTQTPGLLLPAPQWRLASGVRPAVQRLPGSLAWRSLTGETRALAAQFSLDAQSLAARQVCVWLRRVGSPAALQLALHQDAAGQPGAALPGAHSSLHSAEVGDVVSLFHAFHLQDWQGDLDAYTSYQLVLRGSPEDNAANHWELGVHPKQAGGHTSPDGAAWVPVRFCPYLRVQDAGLKRRFHFFHFEDCLYALDVRADGSASHLYLNGERGLATGWSATSLEDADKAWRPGQWAGAWLRIRKGQGAGQARQLAANSASELTLAAAWDQLPDATSEYVIYASDVWQDISPVSGDQFDGPVTGVITLGAQAYFARGAGLPILRMRYNTALSAPAHQFADDGNAADCLQAALHPLHGPQIWRGLQAADTASRAAPSAWGVSLSFGAGISLGRRSTLLALLEHAGQLCALKSDGLWPLGTDDLARPSRLDLAAGPIPQAPAWARQGEDLWLAWGARLLRYTGSALSDESPAKGQGLPAERAGTVSALQPLDAQRMLAALDAGQGVSSLLLWAEGSWHELMRAPQAGQPMQALAVQHGPGMRPRLWLGLGGDLAYLDLPRTSESPLGDAGLAYQHEAVLVGGTIDMGAARLPKYLRSLSLLSRNLGAGVQVHLDVQVDGEIGTPRWRNLGAFYSSPLDSLSLNLGQLYTLRPRLRLLTNQADRPPVVLATHLEGFARTPLRYRWTLRLRLNSAQPGRSGDPQPAPEAFVTWLQRVARRARKIRMRSIWADLDEKDVLVEPPALQREHGADGGWGGVLTLVLREG